MKSGRLILTCLLFIQIVTADVVIMDQGRVKSLKSYSHHLLVKFSGKSKVKTNEGPIHSDDWFQSLVFNPEAVSHYPVFRIDNPEIADAYGIDRQNNRMYSYAELLSKRFKVEQYYDEYSEQDTKDQSLLAKEFVRIGFNFKIYEALAQSFNYLDKDPSLSIQDTLLWQGWGLESNEVSFWNLVQLQPQINLHLQKLSSKRAQEWNTQDSSLAQLLNRQKLWAESSFPEIFNLFPMKHQSEEYWISSRELVLNRFFGSPEWLERIKLIHELRDAHRQGDLQQAQIKRQALAQEQRKLAPHIRFQAIEWEDRYNSWDLVYRSEILFGLALFILMIAQLFNQPRAMLKIALVLNSLGVLLLAIALCIRMYVSQRPPVTNLYETFLFVAFSGSLLGLFGFWRKRDSVLFWMSGVMGLSMCLLAQKNQPMGDTMGVLVAVLDSNFWLTTHVITITLGYAGVCAAGVLGHIYLFKLIRNADKASARVTFQSLIGALGFGLTLSFIGTVLGGIWADQSWGRFWGWDPKENGALLIVLWCTILFHARLAGWAPKPILAAGAAMGISVVMVAWFGVNLLGVGLHSYGFTDGAASALGVFILLQFLLTVITLGIVQKPRK